MTAKRILVVDDEPHVVKACARILELEGFEVRGAAGGAEAIDLYQSEGFDLALVDLKMPDVDGLQVLTAIREYAPSAAVVIFTAYGTKENVVEALRLGACEFLEKPLSAKTLIGTVRHILERGNGTAVRGNLRTLSLSSIVQINCSERNQAHLRIRHQGQEASLFFEDGEIAHAELGSQVGEDAIYEILTWEEGEFELEQGVPPPRHTVPAGWFGLLLEGLRRIDESAVEGLELEVLEDKKELKEDMGKQDLVRALGEVEGVAGAVIAARDGIVLAHDLEGDAEKEGAVAVFVGNAANQVREALALGTFERGVVAIGKDKMLVLEQPDYYIGLLLEERASPALVSSQAESFFDKAE